MADILIRGIEMPCNAEGCEVIIRIQPNGEVLDAHKIHIGATAIPLPEEYGRLIDADALIRDKSDEVTLWCGYEYQDHPVVFEEDIKNAPTIVPAEREVDNGN